MTFHFGLFAPALILLLFPADRLLTRFVELRNFEDFHTLDKGPRFRPWWWVAALWVDPLRSFAGIHLLLLSLGLKLGKWDVLPTAAFSVAIGIVTAAVLAQMFSARERGFFIAPIGFVLGIVAAIAPWKVTAIAATMAFTGMFGMRQFYAFFVGGLIASGFLGFIMSTGAGWLVLAMVAFGLPVTAGLITSRCLGLPTRNAAGRGVPA